MFWLSITNLTPELKGLTPEARPWAIAQKIWRFCNTYGEYHSLPPSDRRCFIVEQERRQEAEKLSESSW